jgi:hypothetical protein
MPPPALRYDGHAVDFSGRIFSSTAVTASPAAAAETAICTLTIGEDVAVTKAIYLFGWFSITIGTNGVGLTWKIRQTDTSGTTKAATGAETVVATQVYGRALAAIDTGPTLPGQAYVLTVTVASGSASSAVSAANLIALVV